jgi:hypothetical protein
VELKRLKGKINSFAKDSFTRPIQQCVSKGSLLAAAIKNAPLSVFNCQGKRTGSEKEMKNRECK